MCLSSNSYYSRFMYCKLSPRPRPRVWKLYKEHVHGSVSVLKKCKTEHKTQKASEVLPPCSRDYMKGFCIFVNVINIFRFMWHQLACHNNTQENHCREIFHTHTARWYIGVVMLLSSVLLHTWDLKPTLDYSKATDTYSMHIFIYFRQRDASLASESVYCRRRSTRQAPAQCLFLLQPVEGG